jgi:hypothetical protein
METAVRTKVFFAIGGAAVIAALLALAVGGGASSVGANGGNQQPLRVTSVPASLSGAGVDINGKVILKPLVFDGKNPAALGFLLRGEAIRRALRYANPTHVRTATLLASFTAPESIPPKGVRIPFRTIENVPAWVITYTYPRPVNAGVGCAPLSRRLRCPKLLVRHASVAIEAFTGGFLLGFFTR